MIVKKLVPRREDHACFHDYLCAEGAWSLI